MESQSDSQQIQRIFWDTQPVPKPGEYDSDQPLEAGPIES
jgi:hypothetical protein